MSDEPRLRQAFAALATLPDEAIDLAQAALLIAREEYPGLDVRRYLARLDEMAAVVSGRLAGGEGDRDRIAHLNRLLFDEMGFRGNREAYFDPRNSFLNDVLDRRVGIPISLSTVYLEVGRRIGWALAGVAFPGHFLVRPLRGDAPRPLLVDPFNRGRILTEDGCRLLLRDLTRGRVPFRPELLKRARNRDILRRMLNNLRAIYHGQRDFRRALRVQELFVCLDPADAGAIRERAMVRYRLACFGEAADDLERYLAMAPGAGDTAGVRRRLAEIRRLAPVWN